MFLVHDIVLCRFGPVVHILADVEGIKKRGREPRRVATWKVEGEPISSSGGFENRFGYELIIAVNVDSIGATEDKGIT